MGVRANRHHDRHRRIGARRARQNLTDDTSQNGRRDNDRCPVDGRGGAFFRSWRVRDFAWLGRRASGKDKERGAEQSEGSAVRFHTTTVLLIDNDCQHQSSSRAGSSITLATSATNLLATSPSTTR